MVYLENETLSMAISTLGAEPQSLKTRKDDREYIWNGDKRFWPRRAPLLFPMTGPTKGNTIDVDGTTYPMPNNGFARDTEFTVLEQDGTKAVFRLSDNEETRKMYPFSFVLTVTYTLLPDGYRATADIEAKEDLFATFGWHPAFTLDINGTDTELEDYYLQFEQPESVDRKYLHEGLLVTEPNFIDDADRCPLSRKETDKGPIVLEGLGSKRVTLRCKKGPHGVTVDRGTMGTFVSWTCAPAHGRYICLEPMASFGDVSRPSELKQMPQVTPIAKGGHEVYENTFLVF
jgi:galactose mutarotase-like enzyme